MNLRILHIVGSIDPAKGGVTEAVRNMVLGTSKLGCVSEILSLDAPSLINNDIRAQNIYSLGPAKTPWQYSSRMVPWLRKNAFSYDVVIVHGLWLFHVYAVYITMRNAPTDHRPKIYLMPHGMLDPYFQRAKGRKLKALRNEIFWKLFDSKLVNNVDGVIFTCLEEKKLAAIPFMPYHPKQQYVVNLGIERSSFETPKPRYSDTYWLYLGRINEKKGVDLLVKAFLRLKGVYADLPQLFIAGPGWDSTYGQSIKNLIDQDKNIHTLSMVVDKEKWELIQHACLFILPSHQENFGIAVVEALSCRVPVLITNKVNIFNEISEAKAGLVCDDSEDGLFNKLREWMALSEIKKIEMSKSAFRLYEKQFNLDSAAQQLMAVINNDIW